MATITARLPEWLDDELRGFWARHGEGPSAGLRQVAEEWWTLQRFPELEFRDGVAGRRAGVRGGPDVWEVVEIHSELEDLDRLVDHFGGSVSSDGLEQALGYAEQFGEIVEEWIERNRRMGTLVADSVGPPE